jgi:UDP-N-acetylmuramate--alanine ligase
MYNVKLHFHFTGIGGSGMSGIAEVLLNQGFQVSGTDLRQSSATDRLQSLGATIQFGHAAENLPPEASLLVFSSAVSMENPEVVEARRRGIPVIRRAEVLAELMRLKYGVAVAGSHGKTTTTSMSASIMEAGGLDPTVIIGGQVSSMASGARLGQSNFLVAETDESDRSFLLLKPTVAVVTNIDSEHLSAYTSMSELEQSFEQFIQSVPFYGLSILCIDDPRVRALAQRYDRRKVTYGISPDAQLRAIDIQHDRTTVRYTLEVRGEACGVIELPIPGRHMAVNSLAAIAVGLEFGIPLESIRSALARFGGVRRRLEVVAEVHGVTIMNDYGHHPTEIRATLAAVQAGWASYPHRLHVVFQPHRYTRTRDSFVDFLDAFEAADSLLLTEIYAASETPIEGISGERLCSAVHHSAKQFVANPEDALPFLERTVAKGDIVLCLGAGSIGSLPEKVAACLRSLPALSGAPGRSFDGYAGTDRASKVPVSETHATEFRKR